MTPKITIVGHVCVDDNTVNGESSARWGSPLLYMARYFSTQHNIKPVLIAPYGTDLKKYVDTTTLANKPKGGKTLRYHNTVSGTLRTQSCANIGSAKPIKLTTEIKKTLQETDIFIFAPLLPVYKAKDVEAIVKHLPHDCLTVILPQGYFRSARNNRIIKKRIFKEYEDILPNFLVLIQSDEDTINSEQDASRWSREFSSLNTIVTKNRLGSVLFKRGQKATVPTIGISESEIKNPIGAGDTFSASFAYHYYLTSDAIESSRKAHEDTRNLLTKD